jgi:IS5 family transposase
LKAISGWLDQHIEVLDWAAKDIQRAGIKNTGRSGMSIEAILRCGLLKQHQQWTYEELAFHLGDSATSAAFARLPRGLYPKRVFGLDRCTWRGLEHFKSYVMSAVLAYNFKLFARLSRQAL